LITTVPIYALFFFVYSFNNNNKSYRLISLTTNYAVFIAVYGGDSVSCPQRARRRGITEDNNIIIECEEEMMRTFVLYLIYYLRYKVRWSSARGTVISITYTAFTAILYQSVYTPPFGLSRRNNRRSAGWGAEPRGVVYSCRVTSRRCPPYLLYIL